MPMPPGGADAPNAAPIPAPTPEPTAEAATARQLNRPCEPVPNETACSALLVIALRAIALAMLAPLP